MSNLFGLTEAAPKARPVRTKIASRSQYRRQEWEDRQEPVFYAAATAVVIPPDTFDDVPADALPLARECAERFQAPIEVPAGTAPEHVRIVKRVVYHLRHANRMRLSVDGDVETPPDFVGGLTDLARFARELFLIDAGCRQAARCIHMNKPGDPSKGWRVQLWDFNRGPFIDPGKPQLGHKGSHLHVGYAKTEAEAWDKLAAWWVKHRGRKLPVCASPGTGLATLASLIGEAASLQGHTREAELAEVSATFLYGDEDEDD